MPSTYYCPMLPTIHTALNMAGSLPLLGTAVGIMRIGISAHKIRVLSKNNDMHALGTNNSVFRGDMYCSEHQVERNIKLKNRYLKFQIGRGILELFPIVNSLFLITHDYAVGKVMGWTPKSRAMKSFATYKLDIDIFQAWKLRFEIDKLIAASETSNTFNEILDSAYAAKLTSNYEKDFLKILMDARFDTTHPHSRIHEYELV